MQQQKGQSGAITVTAAGVALPNIPCSGVILSNWNVENVDAMPLKGGGAALIEEQLNEVLWGYNGTYAHQLFSSQTTPFIIPVNNANEINLRSRTGENCQIWYSVIF